MTEIGIQTDELYINGMPLREFLLLDIPQTPYLKMLDNAADTDADADADPDPDTDSDTEEETFTQEEVDALYEAVFGYIDYLVMSNISSFSDPHFHKKVELGIYELLEATFSDICGTDLFMITYDMEIELESIGDSGIEDYFTSIVPLRSYSTSFIRQSCDVSLSQSRSRVEQNIEYLRSVPQHPQRTPEWYKRRNEMITASSAWKVFKSDSNINQIVYEKCSAAAAALSGSANRTISTISPCLSRDTLSKRARVSLPERSGPFIRMIRTGDKATCPSSMIGIFSL
jgi:hypothetical protein